MDKAHNDTEKALRGIERKIRREYSIAEKEVQDKLEHYLARFTIRDNIKRNEVQSGKITQEEYVEWRKNQMLTAERWRQLRQIIAEDMCHANDIARDIVNDKMPEIYANNYNYATYEVEHNLGINTSFTFYNRDSVESLLRDNPDLLPEPGKATSERIRKGLEVRWNKQQIQSVMLQGILQGESIPRLSKRLAKTVGDRNKVSAIRNARTMTTRAQNYGRLNSYKQSAKLGIDMRKKWVATLDHRTRDSHVDLDGEIVKLDETFSNELDAPAGMGPPEEVYNCRCTMIAEITNEPYTDERVSEWLDAQDFTYDEWKKAARDRLASKGKR